MLPIDKLERKEAKIRYTLQPVPPKARSNAQEEGPYAAHVQIQTTSLASLVQQMVREGSKYSESELIAIVAQLMDVITYRLMNGETVNLGSMVRFKPAIRGAFESLETPFDASKHEVVVSATIGSQLRKRLRNAAVQQVEKDESPILTRVTFFNAEVPKDKKLLFRVTGKHLLKTPSTRPSTWFVRVGERDFEITPTHGDQQRAVFAVNRTLLPRGTTFQLGLRVYLTENSTMEVLYKTPLSV